MKFRGKNLFFLSSLFLLLIIAFSHEELLLAVGDFLIIQDKLHPVDVIHVIAGDDYRTNYAIELYKQGYAKYIFFTGGWCKYHGYYHGKHSKQMALVQGVPIEAIAYDDTSVTSTYAETVKLKAWMDQNLTPIRSVIVISDPFHMRRSRWTAQHLLGKSVEVLMAPVPMERTPYSHRWWENAQSVQYLKDEYQKFAYYIARYQFSWGIVSDWLALLDKE